MRYWGVERWFLAIFDEVLSMGPKPVKPETDELFVSRLDELLNMCHALVRNRQISPELAEAGDFWRIDGRRSHRTLLGPLGDEGRMAV